MRELISCCSCLVTPDQTVNLGVNRDLTVKTLTGVVPTSVTVKLLATLAGTNGTGTSCTNSAATVATATLAPGMRAWITHNHPFTFFSTQAVCLQGGGTWFGSPSGAGLGVCYSTTGIFTEITAIPVSLSLSEGASIGGRCAAILGNGSGFGVCNSCKAGALGALRSCCAVVFLTAIRKVVKCKLRLHILPYTTPHAAAAATPRRSRRQFDHAQEYRQQLRRAGEFQA